MKTHYLCVINTKGLNMFSERVSLYSESTMKHTNTLCGKKWLVLQSQSRGIDTGTTVFILSYHIKLCVLFRTLRRATSDTLVVTE